MTSPAARPRIAELVVDAQAQLGEGPLWSVREQRLYWIDIIGRRLHRSDPASGADEVFALPGMPGAVVERARGGLVLAWQRGFAGFDPATGALEPWCDPEAAIPGNRFNDGKVDAAGRFYAGTMAIDGPHRDQGAVYRLDADRSCHRLFGGVGISNGLAWSADGRTLWYIDTMLPEVAAFAVDPAGGDLGPRQVAIRKGADDPGYFDGMCIDAEGMLWIAHWDGACVSRFDPRRGVRLDRIAVPASRVTSCCFGGARLDTLFITTARLDGNAGHAHAGGVFAVRPGVMGLPATPFAG